MRFDQVIVTCEHASDAVPRELRSLLGEDAERLGTHRSYDLGAKKVAVALAQALVAPIVVGTVSRLVVDLNRSAQHPRVIGPSLRAAASQSRADLLAQFHEPYWSTVRQAAQRVVRQRGRVLHLAVHSFTPELDGEVRNADLGLLYDPARVHESALCASWGKSLGAHYRVRRNYPYRGVSDGLVTHLRKRFTSTRYLGIEIEINQALVSNQGFARLISRRLVEGLRVALDAKSSVPRR